MADIEYIETDEQGLDLTCVLREKLITHHKVHSPGYFYKRYEKMPPANERNKELLEKFAKGKIRVELARNKETEELGGYCIRTISADKEGEIQSIFPETEYRRCGIGDRFMKKALSWMNENSVVKIILAVGAGNEEVFDFYRKYVFYPRTTILEQVETEAKDSTNRRE